MRRLGLCCVLALALACTGESGGPKPLSEPGEKLYDLRGRIVSRDTPDNMLRVDHEAIPGYMEAMTMDFSIRGATVGSLPPDNSRIEARLHVTDRGYWLTDIRQVP